MKSFSHEKVNSKLGCTFIAFIKCIILIFAFAFFCNVNTTKVEAKVTEARIVSAYQTYSEIRVSTWVGTDGTPTMVTSCVLKISGPDSVTYEAQTVSGCSFDRRFPFNGKGQAATVEFTVTDSTGTVKKSTTTSSLSNDISMSMPEELLDNGMGNNHAYYYPDEQIYEAQFESYTSDRDGYGEDYIFNIEVNGVAYDWQVGMGYYYSYNAYRSASTQYSYVSTIDELYYVDGGEVVLMRVPATATVDLYTCHIGFSSLSYFDILMTESFGGGDSLSTNGTCEDFDEITYVQSHAQFTYGGAASPIGNDIGIFSVGYDGHEVTFIISFEGVINSNSSSSNAEINSNGQGTEISFKDYASDRGHGFVDFDFEIIIDGVNPEEITVQHFTDYEKFVSVYGTYASKISTMSINSAGGPKDSTTVIFTPYSDFITLYATHRGYSSLSGMDGRGSDIYNGSFHDNTIFCSEQTTDGYKDCYIYEISNYDIAVYTSGYDDVEVTVIIICDPNGGPVAVTEGSAGGFPTNLKDNGNGNNGYEYYPDDGWTNIYFDNYEEDRNNGDIDFRFDIYVYDAKPQDISMEHYSSYSAFQNSFLYLNEVSVDVMGTKAQEIIVLYIPYMGSITIDACHGGYSSMSGMDGYSVHGPWASNNFSSSTGYCQGGEFVQTTNYFSMGDYTVYDVASVIYGYDGAEVAIVIVSGDEAHGEHTSLDGEDLSGGDLNSGWGVLSTITTNISSKGYLEIYEINDSHLASNQMKNPIVKVSSGYPNFDIGYVSYVLSGNSSFFCTITSVIDSGRLGHKTFVGSQCDESGSTGTISGIVKGTTGAGVYPIYAINYNSYYVDVLQGAIEYNNKAPGVDIIASSNLSSNNMIDFDVLMFAHGGETIKCGDITLKAEGAANAAGSVEVCSSGTTGSTRVQVGTSQYDGDSMDAGVFTYSFTVTGSYTNLSSTATGSVRALHQLFLFAPELSSGNANASSFSPGIAGKDILYTQGAVNVGIRADQPATVVVSVKSGSTVKLTKTYNYGGSYNIELYTFSASSLADGTYTIEAKATAVYGGTTSDWSYTMIVDKSAPVVSLSSNSNKYEYSEELSATASALPQVYVRDANFGSDTITYASSVTRLTSFANTSFGSRSANGKVLPYMEYYEYALVNRYDLAGNEVTYEGTSTLPTSGYVAGYKDGKAVIEFKIDGVKYTISDMVLSNNNANAETWTSGATLYTQGAVKVSFNVNIYTNLTLAVKSGSTVKSTKTINNILGDYSYTLDLSSLANGTYTLEPNIQFTSSAYYLTHGSFTIVVDKSAPVVSTNSSSVSSYYYDGLSATASALPAVYVIDSNYGSSSATYYSSVTAVTNFSGITFGSASGKVLPYMSYFMYVAVNKYDKAGNAIAGVDGGGKVVGEKDGKAVVEFMIDESTYTYKDVVLSNNNANAEVWTKGASLYTQGAVKVTVEANIYYDLELKVLSGSTVKYDNTVMTKKINSNSYTLDLSGYAEGTYSLQVSLHLTESAYGLGLGSYTIVIDKSAPIASLNQDSDKYTYSDLSVSASALPTVYVRDANFGSYNVTYASSVTRLTNFANVTFGSASGKVLPNIHFYEYALISKKYDKAGNAMTWKGTELLPTSGYLAGEKSGLPVVEFEIDDVDYTITDMTLSSNNANAQAWSTGTELYTNKTINIAFTVNIYSDLTLTLKSGNTVKATKTFASQKGNVTQAWDVSSLAEGTYTLGAEINFTSSAYYLTHGSFTVVIDKSAPVASLSQDSDQYTYLDLSATASALPTVYVRDANFGSYSVTYASSVTRLTNFASVTFGSASGKAMPYIHYYEYALISKKYDKAGNAMTWKGTELLPTSGYLAGEKEGLPVVEFEIDEVSHTMSKTVLSSNNANALKWEEGKALYTNGQVKLSYGINLYYDLILKLKSGNTVKYENTVKTKILNNDTYTLDISGYSDGVYTLEVEFHFTDSAHSKVGSYTIVKDSVAAVIKGGVGEEAVANVSKLQGAERKALNFELYDSNVTSAAMPKELLDNGKGNNYAQYYIGEKRYHAQFESYASEREYGEVDFSFNIDVKNVASANKVDMVYYKDYSDYVSHHGVNSTYVTSINALSPNAINGGILDGETVFVRVPTTASVELDVCHLGYSEVTGLMDGRGAASTSGNYSYTTTTCSDNGNTYAQISVDYAYGVGSGNEFAVFTTGYDYVEYSIIIMFDSTNKEASSIGSGFTYYASKTRLNETQVEAMDTAMFSATIPTILNYSEYYLYVKAPTYDLAGNVTGGGNKVYTYKNGNSLFEFVIECTAPVNNTKITTNGTNTNITFNDYIYERGYGYVDFDFEVEIEGVDPSKVSVQHYADYSAFVDTYADYAADIRGMVSNPINEGGPDGSTTVIFTPYSNSFTLYATHRGYANLEGMDGNGWDYLGNVNGQYLDEGYLYEGMTSDGYVDCVISEMSDNYDIMIYTSGYDYVEASVIIIFDPSGNVSDEGSGGNSQNTGLDSREKDSSDYDDKATKIEMTGTNVDATSSIVYNEGMSPTLQLMINGCSEDICTMYMHDLFGARGAKRVYYNNIDIWGLVEANNGYLYIPGVNVANASGESVVVDLLILNEAPIVKNNSGSNQGNNLTVNQNEELGTNVGLSFNSYDGSKVSVDTLITLDGEKVRSVDTSKAGRYLVKQVATDAAGRKNTIVREINVLENKEVVEEIVEIKELVEIEEIVAVETANTVKTNNVNNRVVNEEVKVEMEKVEMRLEAKANFKGYSKKKEIKKNKKEKFSFKLFSKYFFKVYDG